ncbi:NACHT domain-containing protein [Kribbella monticola]|uniref:NACHT domain-containing protein n=1 Tax=Kribbella monticola TaxID=2185285 RepID=UPI0013002B61|nr:hypothetical protein [Kribbella monticola]
MSNRRLAPARITRFWIPEDGRYELTPRGWLADPEDDSYFRSNAEAVPTTALRDFRCLVLLGEPGMGKTAALAAERALLPDGFDGEDLQWNLGRFASELRLEERVFRDPRIQAWCAGEGELSMTLDGFDEAHNRIPSLHSMLADYLDAWPCSRLWLRIVSRAAEWPSSLPAKLETRFGALKTYELLPLRRRDAGAIVKAQGFSAPDFLTAIEAARVVPLAARPLTLNLLIAARHEDGRLPDSTVELYERGLLALADELNPERRDSGAPVFPPQHILRTAERMAAISIFGGKPTIWTGPSVEADSNDLHSDECIEPGAYDAGIGPREILRATWQTALFSRAGNRRLVWSHATFADYLAARWVLSQNLRPQEVRSLCAGDDGGTYSRTRQMVPWLVAMRPQEFRWLLASDPAGFLAGTVEPSQELRSELVSALLTALRAGSLYYSYDWNLAVLAHDDLSSQLLPVLADESHDVVQFAITIARQCNLLALREPLADIALDPAQRTDLRTSAALGVHDLSAEDPTDRLASLLLEPEGLGERVDDELAAAALMASWPHAVSTARVFELIGAGNRRRGLGLHSIFVSDFAARLTDDDLEAACAWVTSIAGQLASSRLTGLIDSVVRLCVHHLNLRSAQEALKALVREQADTYEPLFGEERLGAHLTTDDRHMIALVLFQDATLDQILDLIEWTGPHESTLLTSADFGWLIEKYVASEGPLQQNIGHAATHSYNPADTEHSSIVLGLPADHPAAKLFAHWRQVIELDSPEATTGRERLAVHREHRERRDRRQAEMEERGRLINPRIAECISAALLGDLEAFWTATRLVTIRPTTDRPADELNPDITAHPRWTGLPESVRRDFVSAAVTYLADGHRSPGTPVTQELSRLPSRAAFQALVLLLRNRPEVLDGLAPSVWRDWSPILIAWPTATNGARPDDKETLLRLAMPHALDALITALLAMVDRAIENSEPLFYVKELRTLASDDLADALLTRLRRPIPAVPREGLVEALIETHPDRVASLLLQWVSDEELARDPDRGSAAVSWLFKIGPRQAWPALRHLLDAAPSFMESAIVAHVAHSYTREVLDLPEDALEDLYVWLEHHFATAEDPHIEDAHMVTPRESLGEWRDNILDMLRKQGTRQAVDAIARITTKFPDRPWLQRVLIDARAARREQSWQPWTAGELDLLADRSSAALIRTDHDLFDAALDAFSEIQNRLQGDTPTAGLLWDTYSGRPKTEDQISDFLADQLSIRLHDRGTAVNREVQVRRNRPSGLPERTDLRIEALPSPTSPGSQPILLPGEVKGAWNSDLFASVQDQLVNRYMADFQTSFGIFVVLWFDEESWTDTTDRRRGAALRRGPRERLATDLGAIAAQLRKHGHLVGIVVLDASLRRQRRPVLPD